MFALELWNDWNKIRRHLAHPKLALDDTNNASACYIGESKVR